MRIRAGECVGVDIQQPKRQALPAEAARKLKLDLVCGVLSWKRAMINHIILRNGKRDSNI